ncbi:MAG: ChbG/HpnK family deacetylase [Vicinamibacterales bacterium]
MKRLIVAADDFGLTDGVTAGILEAMAAGVVSCTSAMTAVPGAAERAGAAIKPALEGRIGLHLQRTPGEPCAGRSGVPSLCDGSGRFPARAEGTAWRDADIACEWLAQVERLRAAGIEPAHLDSHHHVHQLPAATRPYASLAATLGVAARGGPAPVREALSAAGVVHADWFETSWFDGVLTVDRFLAIVRRAFAVVRGEGTVELMCHPGRTDRALEQVSRYTSQRDAELAVLCAPDLRRRLEDMDITLVPASALAR